MRKTLLLVLCLATWFGSGRAGLAQSEMKPVAVVSIAGYDALKADIGAIGALCGNPKLAEGLEATLKQMTHGKGLAGVDTKRPWGIASFPRSENAANLPKTIALAFIPVTDLKQLMDVAKTNPRLAQAITLNGDVYQIQGPGSPPLAIQQKGDWAVVSIVSGDLANAPADPLTLLGDLPKDYDVAIRMLVKNMPEQLRKEGVEKLQAAIESHLPPVPGASAQVQAAIPGITQALDDLDEVTVGLKIDSSNNKCLLDLTIMAKTGSKLADQFAAMKANKTAFAGVRIPDAALVITKTQTLTDDEVAKSQAALADLQKKLPQILERQGLPEDKLTLISRLSEDVIEVLKETIETKKVNNAFAVLLEPDAATVVGGIAVADGTKVEKMLSKLADELQKTDEETAKTFKINAKTYQDLHIHYLTIPTPDPRLVPAVGETMKVVVATGSDRVWFAAGRNAAKTLKKAIDDSKAGASSGISPNEVRVSVGKVAKFIGAMADNDAVKKPVDFLIGAIGKSGDKDHVIITATPVASGARIRVEVEEGAIKAAAAMGQAVMTMRAGPPNGPPPSAE